MEHLRPELNPNRWWPGATVYDIATSDEDKLRAARRIFDAAIDAGDWQAADAIRARVRREFGIDAPDQRGAGDLDRACSLILFDLDSEEV